MWAVTADRVTVRALPAAARIEALVRDFRASLSEPVEAAQAAARGQRVEDLARQVSAMLLEPIAAELGTRRLLVVADGILHLMPFAALTLPDPADPERARVPLIAGHEVIQLPSASTLAMLRRDWKRDTRRVEVDPGVRRTPCSRRTIQGSCRRAAVPGGRTPPLTA